MKNKVIATYEASKKPGYTTFLKHFGEFKIAGIVTTEVSKEDYLLEAINELRQDVLSLNRKLNSSLDIPIVTNKITGSRSRTDIDEFVTFFSLKNQYSLHDLADYNGERFLSMVEAYLHEMVPDNIAIKPRHQIAIRNQFEASVSRVLDTIAEMERKSAKP